MKRSLLLLLFLLSSPVLAGELWCDDNPSICNCSEPLEDNGIPDTSIPSSHDFADTTTKECDDVSSGGAFWGTDNTDSVQVETQMPAGNTVGHIIKLVSGTNWMRGDATFASSIKRAGIRFYFKVSNNFSGTGSSGPGGTPCATQRAKLIQFSRSGANSQLKEPTGGDVCTGPYIGAVIGCGACEDYTATYRNFSVNWTGATCGEVALSPSINYFDCMGSGPDSTPAGQSADQFCRAEYYVSTDDPDGITTGSQICFDVYVTRLSDGRESSRSFCTASAPCDGTPLGGVPNIFAADLFHSPQTGGGVAQGWMETGYFAQGIWTTNAGQRIGVASEVEGGSASTIRGMVLSDAPSYQEKYKSRILPLAAGL